jgi:hypothetical protein
VIVVDDRRIVNDRLVDIRVVEPAAHMHDRRVIEEVAAAPFSTGKAHTHIAESVVHAAVVANVCAPIAAMEEIMTAFPAPIRRRPKKARLRSGNPRARHPIVAFIAVSPITRRPHISIFRAWWLHIDWQHRRRNVDANKHSGERRNRNDAH